jgi:hypothetical protein
VRFRRRPSVESLRVRLAVSHRIAARAFIRGGFAEVRGAWVAHHGRSA